MTGDDRPVGVLDIIRAVSAALASPLSVSMACAKLRNGSESEPLSPFLNFSATVSRLDRTASQRAAPIIPLSLIAWSNCVLRSKRTSDTSVDAGAVASIRGRRRLDGVSLFTLRLVNELSMCKIRNELKSSS